MTIAIRPEFTMQNVGRDCLRTARNQKPTPAVQLNRETGNRKLAVINHIKCSHLFEKKKYFAGLVGRWNFRFRNVLLCWCVWLRWIALEVVNCEPLHIPTYTTIFLANETKYSSRCCCRQNVQFNKFARLALPTRLPARWPVLVLSWNDVLVVVQ